MWFLLSGSHFIIGNYTFPSPTISADLWHERISSPHLASWWKKVKVKSLSHVWLCNPMDCSLPGSSVHFPGNSTGVDCHFLLQGIFPTQGSNPGLSHCRQMLYCLSHQGSQLLLGTVSKYISGAYKGFWFKFMGPEHMLPFLGKMRGKYQKGEFVRNLRMWCWKLMK